MQTDSSSQEQLQIYTNWANYYLRKTGHSPSVRDLQTDLRGGDLLARIIQAVFEAAVPGIVYEPSHDSQKLDNLSACLSFIRERGVLLDEVTNTDIHRGSLDAIFSLFYALSVHRQKIKAATVKPQTSTPLHGSRQPGGQDSRATPPCVPPKQKKPLPNGNADPVQHRQDYLRSFGYKDSARKSSLDDSESAPASRGGSLDRKALREERYVGRAGDSFSEDGLGRRRYGLSGSLTPQHDVKKSSSWLSVREASRLSENRRASKNLSVKELVAFLEKGEIPPDSIEGKKLPALPPKPKLGRLDREDEVSFSFHPIAAPESGSVALRHSSVTDVSERDSGPTSAPGVQVDIFSSKFLSTDPATHEYSSAGTPPPQDANTSMEHTFSSARSPIRLQGPGEGPPLPPRNPSMPAATSHPIHRGESFLSDDRFTTVSLLTEHEPPPEHVDPVRTIMASLGPSQITTSLVNSNRLPSPKMSQTVSLSPNTGTTESDLSSPSPDPIQSFQASPLVRAVLERPLHHEEKDTKPGGLVGWATKSFRRMSTPKQNSRKKLPLPDSTEFPAPGLKRASSEWNNKSPRDKFNSPRTPEETALPRSVSLSENLDRKQRLFEMGPPSSEYRPALPARRPLGEKPLSQEILELLEGFDISLGPRRSDSAADSPSNLYANLGEDMKRTVPQRGVTPVTMDTVSIPPTVLSEDTRFSLQTAEKRDSVYKSLLFAQDQLARKDEELRELRERLEFMERAPLSDTPLTPVSSGVQGDQISERKKRTKRRWLLGRSRSQKGELLDSGNGTDLRGLQGEIERLRQENLFLREENSRLKRGGRETPMSPPRDSITSSSPSTGQPLPISLFVLTRDHHDMTQERLIGAGRIELALGDLTWERLDREVVSAFMSHLKSIDPFLLGLDEEIVSAYLLGTLRRHVGARQIGAEGPLDILRDLSRPEILVDLRALSLSNLSYQLLMPARILQQYLDILLRQRRILVLGPPGTGKSHLVETLGQYVCLVSAPRASRAGYRLFSSDRTSLPNILHTLSMSIKLESAKGKVFVFDGVEKARDLDEICNLLLAEKTEPPRPDSPYILATLRSDQTTGLKPVVLQHGLWVVSYLWHTEPVLGLLRRLLRQKLMHLQVSSTENSSLPPLSTQMVDWLPSVFDKINNFIESAYSPAAVFGPGLFLSCPLGHSSAQMEHWFSQTWSDFLFPYLKDAGSRVPQQGPPATEVMKQILESCPIKFNPAIKHKQFLTPSVVESEL